MPEAPDYVFAEWLKEAYEEGFSKGQQKAFAVKAISLLERIVELLEQHGTIRPG